MVYSMYQAKKIALKLGVGAVVFIKKFERRKDGSISWWNTIEIYDIL